MRKWVLLGVASACLTVWLAGCGGGGGGCEGGGGSGATGSPYLGHWVGTWRDAGHAQEGALDVTISYSGSLSGSMTLKGNPQAGSAAGYVDAYGFIDCTWILPDAERICSGRVSIGGNGHLTGTVTQSVANNPYGTATFDLERR